MHSYEPCGSRPGVPWHCIRIKPSSELAAEMHLRRQGFAAWVPMHEVRRANRARAIEPIFRRYGFVQFDPCRDQWGPIRYTRGVASILCRDGLPVPVPQRAMQRLFDQCAPNGVIYPTANADTITVGTSLRIADGPFAELVGICKRTDRDRVWILLSILGRETEVAFDRSAVEAA